MRLDWRGVARNRCRRIGLRNTAEGAVAGLAIRRQGSINPLLVVSNNFPWSFLFAPVLAGAVLLTAFAYVWHRWIRRRPWPQRWL
jgi:CBS-domain-containing membrane protein